MSDQTIACGIMVGLKNWHCFLGEQRRAEGEENEGTKEKNETERPKEESDHSFGRMLVPPPPPPIIIIIIINNSSIFQTILSRVVLVHSLLLAIYDFHFVMKTIQLTWLIIVSQEHQHDFVTRYTCEEERDGGKEQEEKKKEEEDEREQRTTSTKKMKKSIRKFRRLGW